MQHIRGSSPSRNYRIYKEYTSHGKFRVALKGNMGGGKEEKSSEFMLYNFKSETLTVAERRPNSRVIFKDVSGEQYSGWIELHPDLETGSKVAGIFRQ